MKRSIMMSLAAVGVVVVAGAGVWVGRVLATGAPSVAPLTYAGTVTDKDGKPYAAEVDVKIAFYDAAVDGNLKCAPEAVKAAAGTGRFEVVLAGECVAAFRATADLWSQTTVGSGAAQQVMARSHVGAVPYALEADSAKVAGSALSAGGALKNSIDGLTATVGTGGPWVVDSTKTKLGRLVGTWPTGVATVAMTSKGFVIMFSPIGFYTQAFASLDCSGAPTANVYDCGAATTLALPTNPVIIHPVTGEYYVPVTSAGVATCAKMTIKSEFHASPPKCAPVNSPGSFVSFKSATALEVGLPEKIAWPISIEL